MSQINEPAVLGYLQEHGAKTIRELVGALSERGDDPKEVTHLVRSQLIRLKRRNLVVAIPDYKGGKGQLYSAIAEEKPDA